MKNLERDCIYQMQEEYSSKILIIVRIIQQDVEVMKMDIVLEH
jgi:hypothetical protein